MKKQIINIPDTNWHVGQKILLENHLPIRIMAFVDGYIMCRYKGCIPFCETVKEFKKLIEGFNQSL